MKAKTVTLICAIVTAGAISDAAPISKLKIRDVNSATPAQTSPGRGGEPIIIANPQVVPPGLGKEGTTRLTWDAGLDHREAQVIAVVDGRETVIATQGKGTREVRVEPGKGYVYILRDAGKRLASVSVIGSATPDPPPGSPGRAEPIIVAQPAVVQIPESRRDGMTRLIWDAGPQNRTAEVRVQVDGGSETVIATQGKGAREVRVEPGKSYVYTLSMAGRRLASVTVSGTVGGTPGTPGGSRRSQPTISADPQTVQIPRTRTDGATNVIWDAGRDHQDAELWMEVDGQPAALLVKQPRGAREVKVETGKSYLYVLMKGGQRLATVRVRAEQAPSGVIR